MKTPKVLNHAIQAILIFLPGILSAQTNFIEHSFPVHNTTHATSIAGGWVLPLNSEDCGRNWILKYNLATGDFQKLSEADSVGYPSFVIEDILTLPSSDMICAGTANKDADVGTQHPPFLFKMTSTGKILWQTTFQDSLFRSSGGHEPFIKVISAPDGSIYAITKDQYIGKTDSSGHIIWIKQITGANDIAWTSNGITLAYSHGLTLMDTGGNLLKVYFRISSSNITDLQYGTNGKFYAKNAENIYSFDSAFNLVDSFQFNGFGAGTPSNPVINYADDSGYYFANGNSIKAFDLKGNLKWTNYLPTDCKISGLCSNGSQIAVTGSTTTSAFIKSFDINGNTSPIKRDISIIKITPIRIKMHDVQMHISSIACKLNVTIQNTGSEKIDSFYLYSVGPLSSTYYSCADEYISSFGNLNLLAGDTTTLHILLNRISIVSSGAGYMFPLSIKLYTSSPNGKLDQNPSNDTASYSQTVLGINEPVSNAQKINIYPNPASSILYIDNNATSITSLSISDITGKIVMSFANPENHSGIDISGLPTGVYLVKVSNDIGIKVEKIVKN